VLGPAVVLADERVNDQIKAMEHAINRAVVKSFGGSKKKE
jgi:hypothetical protein